MELFPPYFPDTAYLKPKPWHKIIRILSTIFSACSLYSAVLIALLIIKDDFSFGTGFINHLLLLPLVIPSFSLLLVSPTGFSLTIGSIHSHVMLFNNLIWPLAGGNEGLQLGKLLLLAYFVVLIYLPSMIYRFFLNQLLGKRWRKS